MGNLCSRSSNKPDNFSTPGRVIGSSSTPSSAPQNPRAQIPKAATQGQGRTLGSGGRGEGGAGGGDARSAAARAAEARATANAPKGKLGRELDRQQRQTRSDTLEAVSAEERRYRDLREGEEGRRWD
ncbi:MAG: hypothetical protein Q9176_002021 [Flavoplaca citrina]